jgi:hypothetical protein
MKSFLTLARERMNAEDHIKTILGAQAAIQEIVNTVSSGPHKDTVQVLRRKPEYNVVCSPTVAAGAKSSSSMFSFLGKTSAKPLTSTPPSTQQDRTWAEYLGLTEDKFKKLKEKIDTIISLYKEKINDPGFDEFVTKIKEATNVKRRTNLNKEENRTAVKDLLDRIISKLDFKNEVINTNPILSTKEDFVKTTLPITDIILTKLNNTPTQKSVSGSGDEEEAEGAANIVSIAIKAAVTEQEINDTVTQFTTNYSTYPDLIAKIQREATAKKDALKGSSSSSAPKLSSNVRAASANIQPGPISTSNAAQTSTSSTPSTTGNIGISKQDNDRMLALINEDITSKDKINELRTLIVNNKNFYTFEPSNIIKKSLRKYFNVILHNEELAQNKDKNLQIFNDATDETGGKKTSEQKFQEIINKMSGGGRRTRRHRKSKRRQTKRA